MAGFDVSEQVPVVVMVLPADVGGSERHAVAVHGRRLRANVGRTARHL